MSKATHTQAPTCEELPVTVHNDTDVFSAANGFKPFVRAALTTVRGGDKLNGGVGGGRRTQG